MLKKAGIVLLKPKGGPPLAETNYKVWHTLGILSTRQLVDLTLSTFFARISGYC